jgi:hypothetical protein
MIQAINQAFNLIDTKTNKVVFERNAEHEAHKRFDLVNACGIVPYKARAA